jgi:hypothetical protein
MKILNIEGIRFEKVINPGAKYLVFEKLRDFSYAFTFGKSYLLDSGLGEGGWALSWIIGGEFDADFGTITCDNLKYNKDERKKDAWCVRHSSVKTRKFSFNDPTVQEQIQHGFKTVSGQYLKSEHEIINRFHLTPERYSRPLRQLSHEAWRASCAIGLANGKKIFCFPYIEPEFIEKFYEIWLKEMLDLLKESGALVLLPARAKKATEGLCDDIVPVG